MKTVFGNKARRGSALLIVLGFMSFMIISAVSFSIYMRIERQASSNYRHSVTARHMLNSALYRAIDEIDAELRVRHDGKVWVDPTQPYPVAEDFCNKFPRRKDWPGRVKVSALDESGSSSQDAQVLSLEALSYVPPFLVNDLRRYAVRDTRPTGVDGDDADPSYMGAKWRMIERTIDNDIVGRYAYVCVNISDMLNVNACRAGYRDSTNRVSIGHLVSDPDAFDADAEEDIFYFSLQDFYAARYKKSQTQDSSPYHDFLKTQQLTAFSSSPNMLRDHVFCTESIVRPEPVKSTACNITINQPFDSKQLNSIAPVAMGQNAFAEPNGGGTSFWDALKKVSDPELIAGDQIFVAALLSDYLDVDSVPKQLGIPSVELVPMVSKIVLNGQLLSAKVYEGAPSTDKPPQRQFGIQIIDEDLLSAVKSGNQPLLDVQVVWPFKYAQARLSTKEFKVRARLGFKLAKESEIRTKSVQMTDYKLGFLSTSDTPIDLSTIPQGGTPTDNDYYVRTGVKLKLEEGENANPVLLTKVDDKGVVTPIGPYQAADNVAVACMVLVQIIDEDGYAVDQVPCMIYLGDPPKKGDDDDVVDAWKTSTQKLYYVTDPIIVNTLHQVAADPVKSKLGYTDYNSLEIPDPRFNHFAINWVASSVAWSTPTGKGSKNPSTVALFGQKDGRDADIFMAVSDAGYMQSPGELGFIVRPYPGLLTQLSSPMSGPAVDFKAQKTVNALPANSDKDAMFRTFRLYDHGSNPDYKKDDIYGCFYAMNEDGTVTGPRVNPLSDFDSVLEAALWNTPLDYWFASTNKLVTATQKKDMNFNVSKLHFDTDDPADAAWMRFRDQWMNALTNAVSKDVDVDGKMIRVNREWKSNVKDVYGVWDVAKWYSDDTTRLEMFGVNNLLSKPMHEIDRKMLFSFTLDSFSDRQQLFMYFIKAEATVPAFGGGAVNGMRSLAGGRAVAVVWRDPYPRGYDKANNTWDQNATGPNRWYDDNNNLESPWVRYYLEEGAKLKPNNVDDPRKKNNYRWDSYHDHRVLFFKQLD